MANENNKISNLVSESDDDPTLEIESLSVPNGGPEEIGNDADSDEDTFDVDSLDDLGELSGNSIAALKSDIKLRNESIARLQFDIEQLRARWTGLEKEIKAREELTDTVNQQLSETQRKLSRSEERLSQRDADVQSLQKALEEKTSLLASVEQEALNISAAVESGKAVIEQLQSTVTGQQSTISSLQDKIDSAESAHQSAITQLDGKTAEISTLGKQLSDSEKRRKTAEKENSKLKDELRESAARLEDAQQQNQALSAAHESAVSEELEASRDRISALDGTLTDSRHEIAELKTQIARTEQYADGLRVQLLAAATDSSDNLRQKQQLEAALADAGNQINDLSEQLESERLIGADMRAVQQQMQSDFDDEIRKIRFELGTAQETISDQETINERLASDLLDNEGYRQALEAQIDSNEKENEKTIRELKRKAHRLEHANDEITRTLENKDNAIAALLSELASRSRTVESLGEIENVIHEIDGRMSGQIDEKTAVEKDRMARLLIGNVDGQELQFPLFKDRLTIGRTAHNDIQLKAQFISRRHALIVTENEQTRIVDWGSKNGVYVNDERVAEHFLTSGDVVAIGTAEFRYEERPKR